jgi:hypothetical protein
MEDARCDFSQPTTDEDDDEEAASMQAAAKFESIMDHRSKAAKHLTWQ